MKQETILPLELHGLSSRHQPIHNPWIGPKVERIDADTGLMITNIKDTDVDSVGYSA